MAQTVSLTKATGTLTVTANFSSNDTVLIGNVVYKFEATPAAANDIDIGTDAEASLANLVLAINNTGAAPSGEYFAATLPITEVTASATATVLTLTAAFGGVWANYVELVEGVDGSATFSITRTMQGGVGDLTGPLGWFESLFSLNQINSEVLQELKVFTEAAD